ncbi:hypothetical protein FQZ97_853110 [compost metagenome]
MVRWNDSLAHFEACSVVGGVKGGWGSLESLVERLGCYHGEGYEVAENLRKKDRQLGAFWGYLKESYGANIKDRIALPRLLVNWGIQPWFKSVWNIDRVILIDNQIWALEVKHKFPYFGQGHLRFGLNNGETYLIRDLVGCGIKVLHAIIVKPYWNMDTGSSYLISNYTARSKALVLGAVFGEGEIQEVLKRLDESSPVHTSVDGKSRLKFKAIPVTDFTPLSFLNNREEVAARIALLLRGELIERCSDEQLRALKIER